MSKRIYYHTTDARNVLSILTHGIKPNFGQVYCSTNPDASFRWICFTRPQIEKVALIAFVANPDDMRLGIDHSPMMTEMPGVPDGGSSFTIGYVPPETIVRGMIQTFDNPFAKHTTTPMKAERGLIAIDTDQPSEDCEVNCDLY